MLRTLLAAGLAAALVAPSQTPPPPAHPIPVLERLAREAMTRPGAYDLLADLCKHAPQRLSGSPGAAAAIEWARQAMQRAGLVNVRLEPVLVPHWERGPTERLTIVTASGAPIPLRACALGGSPPTPAGGLRAEVVVVRSLEELAALGEAARGKAVLFNRPMDPTLADPFEAYGGAVDQRGQGSVAAFQAGAAFAIVRSMTLALDDHPHTGSMRYEKDGCVPAVAVSTLGAERLAALVARGERVEVELELACRWHADAPSFNVVGEIPGREKPEEIVVVGGHLDAWDLSVGAHDDGAGCVQAIEVARLFHQLELRPRRTLRVVLWMNEENGLRGARAYRDGLGDAVERHVLALESDRGGFAPRGFTTNATGASLATLQAIGRTLEPYGIQFVRSTPHVAPDVTPLQEAGVVCASFIPEAARYFDLHHSEIDTLDKVHPRELELGALCMAALCYAVAELGEPLPREGQVPDPAGHHGTKR